MSVWCSCLRDVLSWNDEGDTQDLEDAANKLLAVFSERLDRLKADAVPVA